MTSSCTIGVVALQGAFREHIDMVKKLASQNGLPIQAVEVRDEHEILHCDALILPGGESTAMRIIAENDGFMQALRDFSLSGRPVFGTCAGAILLSAQTVQTLKGGHMADKPHHSPVNLSQTEPGILGAIDVVTCRNFFGRQFQSFEAEAESDLVPKFPCVFIRAPAFLRVGPGVQELAAVNYKGERIIVGAQCKNILVTCFHPELTDDIRLHKYFVDLVLSHKASVRPSH